MRAETEAAIAAAEIAQKITDSRQGADTITIKAGIDPVTATDVACEDAIRTELLRHFPQYPVIGEERGGAAMKEKPYWLVDPICGTRLFASNIPLYCTNIALVENGVVTVAAVGVGRSGEIIYAEKGKGARMRTGSTDTTLSVRDDSHAIWIEGKTEHAATVVHNALLLKRWYVWLFSSTVSYAYLAAGRIAGIINFGIPATDDYGSVHTAAGCFVSAEAGAIVTDLDTDGEWTLNTRSLLFAASKALHDELRDMVRNARRVDD